MSKTLQKIFSDIPAEPTGAQVLARVMRLEAIVEKACGNLDDAYNAAVPPPPPPPQVRGPAAPQVAPIAPVAVAQPPAAAPALTLSAGNDTNLQAS